MFLYISETMIPQAPITVTLHPLPAMNVMLVVSSLMSLVSQGHTNVRGQATVRYC